jgi:hypothetical protein
MRNFAPSPFRTAAERKASAIRTRHRPVDAVLVVPAQWLSASLQNSWVNYGAGNATMQYMKGADEIVHVRGVIKDGTGLAGTLLFTLPEGYRPPLKEVHMGNFEGSMQPVDVEADGEVRLGEAASSVYGALNFTFSTRA